MESYVLSISGKQVLLTTILKWFECSFRIFIIEYVGWDDRTLPFFYERTRQGA